MGIDASNVKVTSIETDQFLQTGIRVEKDASGSIKSCQISNSDIFGIYSQGKDLLVENVQVTLRTDD